MIDDSPTIRKMVECHLSQAGYRVALAVDAESGLRRPATVQPNLILLDHQLPGTTGDEVCKLLLDDEATARIPVVLSSAMREPGVRALHRVPERRRSDPQALHARVAQERRGQRPADGRAGRPGAADRLRRCPRRSASRPTWCSKGTTAVFPFRAVLDFLNNGQHHGRLTLETGKDRLNFSLSGGRVQAAVSNTVAPSGSNRPARRPGGPGPAAAVDARASNKTPRWAGWSGSSNAACPTPGGSAPCCGFRRPRSTHRALTGEPGKFLFDPRGTLPPMFQAFPLQMSLAALAVEGDRRCEPPPDARPLGPPAVTPAKTPEARNLDRAGLTPTDLKVHTFLDGTQAITTRGREVGRRPSRRSRPWSADWNAPGWSSAGAPPRAPRSSCSTTIPKPGRSPCGLRARGRRLSGESRSATAWAAQLLLTSQSRSASSSLPLDRPEQEAFYSGSREQSPATTRFIGIVGIDDESELARSRRTRPRRHRSPARGGPTWSPRPTIC